MKNIYLYLILILIIYCNIDCDASIKYNHLKVINSTHNNLVDYSKLIKIDTIKYKFSDTVFNFADSGFIPKIVSNDKIIEEIILLGSE